MTDFPFLLLMIAVPAIGAAVVAALPRGRDLLAKQVTLGVSLVVLLLAVLATVAFDAGGDRFQLTTAVDWIPDFGVQFALGVDGIALVMLLLIGVLVPVVIGASWRDELPSGRSMTAYFAWLLLLEAFMVGVFAATDIFLFYVFFEAMLVPMYFIIGSFGGPRRQYAAVKFFLYSLVGGLIMLAAVIGLYVVSNSQLGEGTFAFDALRGLEIDPGVQKLLFLGFFIAFAIKAPLVPFHTWLPDSGSEAPIGGAVLLVGVLDKVGTFGFLRYCLPLFPDASRVLRAVRPRARGRRHPVRRAAGDGAERHEAAGRLHVDLALRLHRAGHLRVHDRGGHRRGALHGQPRHRDRPAVPRRRHADRPRRLPADRRLRRRRGEGAAAGGRLPARRPRARWPCPGPTASSASSSC